MENPNWKRKSPPSVNKLYDYELVRFENHFCYDARHINWKYHPKIPKERIPKGVDSTISDKMINDVG